MTGPLIYYVRHGQTDWNAELRWQGRIDIPLNETGRNQAQEYGRLLARLKLDLSLFTFISSPLSRSCETLEIIRKELNLPPNEYETDDRLIEINYGDLEGTTQSDFKASNREMYYYRKANQWTFKPENGENHEDVLKRVIEWHSDLDRDGQYIVAAHGAVGRVVRHHLAGIPRDELSKMAFPQDKVFKFIDGREEVI